MNWYEYFLHTPVKALNDIRSNVWSVVLIATGIMLVLHGHENVGGSLVTGAFAVFRSSRDDEAPLLRSLDTTTSVAKTDSLKEISPLTNVQVPNIQALQRDPNKIVI